MSKSTPMNIDEFVVLDNKMDGDEPAALVELRHRSPLYITALKPESKADVRLTKRADIPQDSNRGVWELDMGQDFILGQLGEDGEAIARPKAAEREKKSVDPRIPDWSGIAYHPKLSESRFITPFRGAKGKRTIPHYIFGPDDRQVYYPDSYPWRCIGKILAWTNPSGGYAWSGTGVLVGRNIVLTCSHMCPWGVSPWMIKIKQNFLRYCRDEQDTSSIWEASARSSSNICGRVRRDRPTKTGGGILLSYST
jgi:hypothetical protein